MDDITYVIVVSFSILSLFEFIRGCISSREASYYRKQALIEKSRREFGELRTQLFDYTRNNTLDINSASVQFYYLHLTDLVRNPDNFQKHLVDYILFLSNDENFKGEHKKSEIFIEMLNWPREVKDNLFKVSDIISNNLLPAYMPLWMTIMVRIMKYLRIGQTLCNHILDKYKKENSIQDYNSLNASILAFAN